MRYKIYITFYLLFSSTLAFTQAPSIDWQYSLGGTLNDFGLGCSRQPTPDGGYILCGWSRSNDGDVTGHHGTAAESDAWIVKLDSNGYIDWQHSYGGTLGEYASDVTITSDGGYIFCSQTYSSNGDVTGNHSTGDVWIVKLDVNGMIQWQQSYGGPGEDFPISILEKPNGGYLINATTTANGGDVTGYHGGAYDIWLISIDDTGSLLWQKCIGGNNYDASLRNSTLLEPDGSIILAATTQSTNGDVSFNHGVADLWLVKTDSLGNIIWEKTYGGTGNDNGTCLTETADGGYLIAGETQSPVSGDITFRYGTGNNSDMWMAKTDSIGNIQWVKTLGGTSDDRATAVSETGSGGYYLLGSSGSSDFDVTNYHGILDYWFLKIDQGGTFEWGSCYGGTDFELVGNFCLANDGGILLHGSSSSNDGDVSGHHGPTGFGNSDIWVAKLFPPLTGIESYDDGQFNLQIYPNPNNGNFNISFTLEKPAETKIEIFDITGRKINSLINQSLAPGEYQFRWDLNNSNQKINQGLYLLSMTINEKTTNRIVSVTE